MNKNQSREFASPDQNASVGKSSLLAKALLGLAAVVIVIAMFAAPGRGLGVFGQGAPSASSLATATKAIEDIRALIDPQSKLAGLNGDLLARLAADIAPLLELDRGNASERSARALLLIQSTRELGNQLSQMTATERAASAALGNRVSGRFGEWTWADLQEVQPTLAKALSRGNLSPSDDLVKFYESTTNALAARQELLLRSDFDWAKGGVESNTASGANTSDFLLGIAIALLAAAGFMVRSGSQQLNKAEPVFVPSEPKLISTIDSAELELVAKKIKDLRQRAQAKPEPQANHSSDMNESLAAMASAAKIVEELSKNFDAGTHQENLIYDFARIADLIEISSQRLKEITTQKTEPAPYAWLSQELELLSAQFGALKLAHEQGLAGARS